MKQRPIESPEEYGNSLYRALMKTRSELEARRRGDDGDGAAHELESFVEHLAWLLEQFRKGEWIPRTQRAHPMTRVVVDSWNWDNPLGLLIAEIENYWCRQP